MLLVERAISKGEVSFLSQVSERLGHEHTGIMGKKLIENLYVKQLIPSLYFPSHHSQNSEKPVVVTATAATAANPPWVLTV